MTENFRIRPATTEDAPDIAKFIVNFGPPASQNRAYSVQENAMIAAYVERRAASVEERMKTSRDHFWLAVLPRIPAPHEPLEAGGKSFEEVAGICGFSPADDAGDEPEIHSVYMAKRGAGVGSGIIDAVLESDIVNQQPITPSLWVVQSNPRAIRFYEKRGFTVVDSMTRWHLRDGTHTLAIPDCKMTFGALPKDKLSRLAAVVSAPLGNLGVMSA